MTTPDPAAGLREALDAWERNGAPNRRSLAAFGITPTLTTSPDRAGLLREALRLSAIRLHQSHDPDHSSATFDKCPAMPCYQARRALADPEPLPMHAPTCMGYDANDGPCAVSGWADRRAAARLTSKGYDHDKEPDR